LRLSGSEVGQGRGCAGKYPSYVRDNIHIDLLAQAYASYVNDAATGKARRSRLNPSGYVESQGAFATRFAAEIGQRLNIPAKLALATQTDFSEPLSRVNLDRITAQWDEKTAWDQLAAYYRQTYFQ